MPFQTTRNGDMVRVDFTGVVSGEDLRRLGVELAALDERAEGTLYRLADFSRATSSSFTPDDVRSLSRTRNLRRAAVPGRTAIIAPNDADFGDARMFEMLNTRPEVAIQVFRSEADAIRWLTSADPVEEK